MTRSQALRIAEAVLKEADEDLWKYYFLDECWDGTVEERACAMDGLVRAVKRARAMASATPAETES